MIKFYFSLAIIGLFEEFHLFVVLKDCSEETFACPAKSKQVSSGRAIRRVWPATA